MNRLSTSTNRQILLKKIGNNNIGQPQLIEVLLGIEIGFVESIWKKDLPRNERTSDWISVRQRKNDQAPCMRSTNTSQRGTLQRILVRISMSTGKGSTQRLLHKGRKAAARNKDSGVTLCRVGNSRETEVLRQGTLAVTQSRGQEEGQRGEDRVLAGVLSQRGGLLLSALVSKAGALSEATGRRAAFLSRAGGGGA